MSSPHRPYRKTPATAPPLPPLRYPSALPITARKDEIVGAIRKHQVTIVTGETGSGKTTQLPKMCIEAGRGRTGLIGCTQPRRVAAVTVAQRLAEEMGEDVGRSVAYKIRFDEKTGPRPFVKVMTDGVLLVEAQSDRLLRRYDTLVVDEAHERSLNIDFVLGILRSLLPRRPDLKVIITSATLDTEKFARAFQEAPVIEVSGRMYPVEVRWRPPDPEGEEGGEDAYVEAAVSAMEDIRRERLPGDTLIFMPTEQDIWETCELLTGRWGDETTVLPLFARLPIGEQRRVFQPASRSRIIVATNVAETSLTIPNIRYVIDTGLARIAQYNPRSRTAGLPVRPISQSSAEQRKGRCGRVREGVCIRLYSQEDFQARPLYTPPEILRSNLAGVILQMLYLRLGDIAQFPFIDQPAKKNIADALEILVELGAVRKAGKDDERTPTHPYHLTEQGRVMARLPLDPRIARMMIEGRQRGCLRETAVIASALSVSDPRERPPDRKAQADSAHAVYRDDTSDFNTLLRLWTAYTEAEKAQPSQNRMRKYCQSQYLSYKRMREWRDVHRQILQIMAEETADTGATEAPPPAEGMNAALHKTILSGYLGHIAQKKEKNLYQGAKGREALIFPGSALWGRGGEWIVAAEWVETSRLYARIAARVEPEWIEEMGRDLCRRSYSNPRWEKNREDVVADEQVTLFGLVVCARRTVSFSRLHADEAAPIFIRQGLIPGALKRLPPFLRHNLALSEKLRGMENKLRRHDLLDEETLFHFYAQRLPGVASGSALRKRLQQNGGDKFLFMEEADMLQAPPDTETLAAYPDQAIVDGLVLPLTYQFVPGSLQDGVTLTIPAGVLPGIDPKALDWLVPGLLPEKIHGLLKGLPKEYRRKLPPLQALSEALARAVQDNREGSLITALGNALFDQFGISVPAGAWPSAQLPDRLKMRLAVVDSKQKILSVSRDIRDLRDTALAERETAALDRLRSQWERSNLMDWGVGDLPERLPLEWDGRGVGYAYPGLEDRNGEVVLRVFQRREEAEHSHSRGVRRLYEIALEPDLRHLKKTLTLSGPWRDWAPAWGGIKKLEGLLYNKVTSDLMALPIRSQADFDAHREEIRRNLLPRGVLVLQEARGIVEARAVTLATLDRLERANPKSATVRDFLRELRDDLDRLTPADCLHRYDAERLTHICRYLRALALRAERGLMHLEKARARSAEIREYSEKLASLESGCGDEASPLKRAGLEQLRWMIEEYKVSLFAQELKTPYPISKKRLDEKIDELNRVE